jgi:uncharacterized protein (TIRG00374 family)
MKPLIVSAVIGMAFYLVTMLVTDLPAVLDASGKVGLSGWITILGLSLLNYGLRYLRWQAYLGWLGYRIPFARHLAYYLAGFAFTTTPGKAGEAVRSVYLKRHKVGYTSSLSAFFVERLMDVVAMILLASVGALIFEKLRWSIILLAVAILLLLPMIHSRSLQSFTDRAKAVVTSARIRDLLVHFQTLLRSSSVIMSGVPFYFGLVAGLLAWGAEAFGFYLVLEYLDCQMSVWVAMSIYAASVLVGAISFLPGGLGSTEAAMLLLLNSQGVTDSTAVAATLICRIATLWFAVAIGFGAVLSLGIKGRHGLTE